jgi:hypothetical protein
MLLKRIAKTKNVPLREIIPGKLLVLIVHTWVQIQVIFILHYFIRKALGPARTLSLFS